MATPEAVEEAVYAVAASLRGVAWYGFGSFFKGAAIYADIDILAVCPDAATGAQVRAVLADLCADWPIHLTVMDRVEADATGFVQTESCLEFAKLAKITRSNIRFSAIGHAGGERARAPANVPHYSNGLNGEMLSPRPVYGEIRPEP